MAPRNNSVTHRQRRERGVLERGARRPLHRSDLRACGKAHWYPRAICPFCASDKIEWRAASGKGTIYTYSVMRRAKEPYAIAYVTLAEGPTMMTNIVDCDFDALRVGQPVSVVFKDTENGPPVPMFKPA